jgi:hypothetical protein
MGKLQIQRICCFVPGALHFVTLQTEVLITQKLQDLVLGEVESSLHLRQASLHGVAVVTVTRLATQEMGNKGPTFIPQTGMVFFHHFLVLIHYDNPVSMQVERALQKHFVAP